jgi:hypothetical protein
VAKQEVVYRTVADTGERGDNDAIAPITSGERVGQVVLQRPDENLRSRTEIDRTELEAQKYLQDSDMRWIITGGDPDGQETGSDIPYVDWTPGTGIFTISDRIVVQHLTSPDTDVQQTEDYSFTDLVPNIGNIAITPIGGVAGTRSYNGANRLEIVWATDAGGAFVATAALTGDPIHILTITVRADGTSTVGQVDTALGLILPASGFSYVAGGVPATQIPGINPLPGDVILSGTFERELHTISAVELAAFFGAESLTEGDTLAIWYDELTEADPSTDGRRQSCDANSNTVLIAGQLTNLTTHPERIPLAIPLCKRIGDDLLFIDGTVVAGALTNSPLNTTFGIHGYMLDMVFGGGLFNDATYFAWLGVNATTFQEAWDNYIGVMDESVSAAAAGLLGFDDTTVLIPLWGGAAASIQDAIDDVMNLLDFPGAGLAPVSGATKIGFDGAAPGVGIIPSFDVWTGLFSLDVWDALMHLGDALQDPGPFTGASGASRIGYDDVTFNLWTGIGAATVQAALDALVPALSSIAAHSGASMIGYQDVDFHPWIGQPAVNVQKALDTLVGAVARVAALDYITGEWWFYGDYDFNTSLQASTYPRGADVKSRLASPGEGWYAASYGNPADKGGAVPGVDSNYYDFGAEPVVDTLVFWDTLTDHLNARKMFVFLCINLLGGPDAVFYYGDALTGTLEGTFAANDVAVTPMAFCADDTNNIYTYLTNGDICKYAWDGVTFIPDVGNPMYNVGVPVPGVPLHASLAKILYRSDPVPGNGMLIIPTGGVGITGSGLAAIQVINTAVPAVLQFETDCVGGVGAGAYNFAGGLEQNGQKIWATFDKPGFPGIVGEYDYGTTVDQILHTFGDKYVPRELLYDGYRLWYYLLDYTTIGPLNDLVGYYNIEVPGVTWFYNAYDMGGTIGSSAITGQQRFGFDGFNLWFYVERVVADQLCLMKLPVASADTTAGIDISVDAFAFHRCEVSSDAWTPPVPHNYGRIFFDGFTLWLGPEYSGGFWGVRIPWAVIR